MIARFGIIILNYMVYTYTINCVKDFLNQMSKDFNFRIVIVDNNSPNDSYEILTKEFENDARIIVKKTPENMGFARGNNYGYKILTDGFEPDFVIISNNDISLIKEGLLSWIIEDNKKYNFDVLGPDIYSTRYNYHQSPMPNKSLNYSDAFQDYKELTNVLKKTYFKCLIKRIIHHKKNKKISVNNSIYWNHFSKSLTLHGAFLVFSSHFFRYYNEPFDAGTFLYMEEDILRLRCIKKNLNMIYDPSYIVNHFQDSSGNFNNRIDYFKDYKRLKMQINSYRVYLKLLEDYE